METKSTGWRVDVWLSWAGCIYIHIWIPPVRNFALALKLHLSCSYYSIDGLLRRQPRHRSAHSRLKAGPRDQPHFSQELLGERPNEWPIYSRNSRRGSFILNIPLSAEPPFSTGNIQNKWQQLLRSFISRDPLGIPSTSISGLAMNMTRTSPSRILLSVDISVQTKVFSDAVHCTSVVWTMYAKDTMISLLSSPSCHAKRR
jgi:hypothetical protein